ncbi:MAG: PAS domain S-box protein [Candidatus Aminicenantales bacterium]
MRSNDLKLLAIQPFPGTLTTLRAFVKEAFPACSFSAAPEGPLGVASARIEDPDVILLDITGPGTDGLDICRTLKADKRLRTIPVVFLTSVKTGRESRVRALEAGADAFLSQPMEHQEGAALIRAMAKIKTANRTPEPDEEGPAAPADERARELEKELVERRRTERELQKRVAYIKLVLDNLPIGIAVNSVDPIVSFQFMNDNFPQFYRTTREALAGPDAFWEAVYEDPEFRETIKKRVLDDCASGDPERMLWTDIPITRRGEGTFFITARDIPIPDQKLVISVVWDVTARKQAEDALRESEDKFKYVFEAANVGKSITLLNGEISANRAFCDILGYAPEGLADKTWRDITPADDIDAIQERLNTLLSGEKNADRFNKRYVRRDGSIFWADVSVALRRDPEGNPLHFITTLIDITERIRTEEALRSSLKEKEALLKEIHHRVKNNMQVISSLLNLQARQITDLKLQEVFRETQRRIRSMSLVHEKLYQSRDLSRIDFVEYTRTLATQLIQALGSDSNHIDLKFEMESVSFDINTANPLCLILSELLSNALKHAFPGKRKGEILIRLCRLDENTYQLTVRDDGIGLPPGFDLNGTGSFGMQVVQTLVQQLNGDIMLGAGKGASFEVRFQELKYLPRLDSVKGGDSKR